MRGLLLFVAIFGMYLIGLGLSGKVYTPNTGDVLDILNFAGQLGMGLLYVLARVFGMGRFVGCEYAGGLWDEVPGGGGGC